MKMREVNGFSGRLSLPCRVFVYELEDGSCYYAAFGRHRVRRTHEYLEEGVDTEEIEDFDLFLWQRPIESVEELRQAVES